MRLQMLLLAASFGLAVLGTSSPGVPVPDAVAQAGTRWITEERVPEDPAELACQLYGDEEPGAARSGAFYTNFWPNGLVPYDFADGNNVAVDSVVLTDVIFRIPFDGPEIISATGFNMTTFAVNDIVRVRNSTSNDFRNMEIVSRTGNNGPLPDTLKVELGLLSTFNAANETGNPVTVFVNNGVNQARRDAMVAAMAIWEDVSGVNFVPLDGHSDYILVENSNRNSVLGNVGHGSGERTLLMGAWGSQGVMIHELGHSLGLKHEHQRPDRNTYISVDTSIVQTRFVGDYAIDNSITIYPDLTYDFGSIMHYGQNGGIQAGATGPVITVLQPWTADWQNNIGQRNGLSWWDAKTMSFMYPESSWRFLHAQTSATTNDGQFLTPWDDFDTVYVGTPTNGRMIVTHPGTYVEPGVYSKSMVIEAPQGGVVLRAQ